MQIVISRWKKSIGLIDSMTRIPIYVLAIASALIVSILWITPGSVIRPSKVYLTLSCSSAMIKCSETESWNKGAYLHTEYIGLTQVDSFYFRPIGGYASETGDAWIDLFSCEAILEELSFDSGNTARFFADNDSGITILANRAAGRISVDVNCLVEAGNEANVEDTSCALLLTGPDDLMFRAGVTSLDGMVLTARLQEPMVFSGLKVTDMEFARPDVADPDLVELESSIESGNITLPEISRTVEIRRGEILSFSGLKGLVVWMKILDRIDLYLVGEAKEIRLGPKGYDRELTPNLLEFVYYRKRWALLFSALMFVLGILRSTRRL